MIGEGRHKFLPRSAGLAEGDGFGRAMLLPHTRLPEGRGIRPDEPASTLVFLGRRQHCGRPRTGEFGLIRAVPSRGAGIAEGNGNSPASVATRRAAANGAGNRSHEDMRRNRENAPLFDSGSPGQAMMPLFAIRYSLFAGKRGRHV